jgi:hypothetical protein
VRRRVGLKPYFFSIASSSSAFMSRDIGPSCAVPSMSAGGRVLEPLPSTWMTTFG